MNETKVTKRFIFTIPETPFMIQFHEGFPTGAGTSAPFEEVATAKVDALRLLIKNPDSTEICEVSGDSMEGHGIYSGDLIFIDKSIEPKLGNVVVVNYDGVELVKVWEIHEGREVFASRNGKYHPMPVNEHTRVLIRGVVVRVIHDL